MTAHITRHVTSPSHDVSFAVQTGKCRPTPSVACDAWLALGQSMLWCCQSSKSLIIHGFSFHEAGHHAGFNVVVTYCHHVPEISPLSGFNATQQFTFRSSHFVNFFQLSVEYSATFGCMFSKAWMRLSCSFFDVHALHPCYDRPYQGFLPITV